MDSEVLCKVFDDFDQDKSGKIDANELRNVVKAYYEVVGESVTEEKVDEEVQSVMKDVDSSKDGKIDKEEFLKYFEKLG